MANYINISFNKTKPTIQDLINLIEDRFGDKKHKHILELRVVDIDSAFSAKLQGILGK